MIGLLGRHPVAPPRLATDSASAAAKLTNKTRGIPVAILAESDFPDHWKRHKKLFYAAQHLGKCAYCEAQTSAVAPGDVEHFRPKSFVQGMSGGHRDDTLNTRASRTKSAKEGGYWWLAYEWSNYLLACSRCNSSWKANQFPVAATRATGAGQESAELALLLNPYDEDPSGHFEFDALTGQIKGVTARGDSTVYVCGLDRRTLDVDRATKGQKMLRRRDDYVLAIQYGNLLAQRVALRALLDECRDTSNYAAMARYFVSREIELSYDDLLGLEQNGTI